MGRYDDGASMREREFHTTADRDIIAVSTVFGRRRGGAAMGEEKRTLNDIWLPAIVITAINGGLFLAFFAGIAGL